MPTTLPEIAIDEAGQTGADLLNEDQPIFALASVRLSVRQAEELLSIARTHQTQEIKFKSLKRNAAGKRRIANLVGSQKLTADTAKATFYHKRFMVTAKVVDILIESVLHQLGYDLYRNGANIALANLHFGCMPTLCGKDRTQKFLRRFIEMIRVRDTDTVDQFYSAADDLYVNSRTKEYAELLEPILVSRQIIDHILDGNDRNSLDPAIPAVVHHCMSWGEAIGGLFCVLHDESESALRGKADLEDLMSRGEPEDVVGYDRRKFVLPLRAREIKFVRSDADARIQVADLVASAGAYWVAGCASAPRDPKFWKKLDAANVGRFAIDAIWPTEMITPAELGTEYDGGTNPVKAMADVFRARRK